MFEHTERMESSWLLVHLFIVATCIASMAVLGFAVRMMRVLLPLFSSVRLFS